MIPTELHNDQQGSPGSRGPTVLADGVMHFMLAPPAASAGIECDRIVVWAWYERGIGLLYPC